MIIIIAPNIMVMLISTSCYQFIHVTFGQIRYINVKGISCMVCNVCGAYSTNNVAQIYAKCKLDKVQCATAGVHSLASNTECAISCIFEFLWCINNNLSLCVALHSMCISTYTLIRHVFKYILPIIVAFILAQDFFLHYIYNFLSIIACFSMHQSANEKVAYIKFYGKNVY